MIRAYQSKSRDYQPLISINPELYLPLVDNRQMVEARDLVIPKLPTTFGKRLAIVRKAKGWSRARLAREVGCTHGIINQIETDQVKEVRTLLMLKIADALGANPRWIATGLGAVTGLGNVTDDERHMVLLYRNLRPTYSSTYR